MKRLNIPKRAIAFAILVALGGCSSWQGMDKTQGTVVGGAGGAYVGNETTGKRSVASATPPPSTTSSNYDPAVVRSVQQALNDKGYNAGYVEGQWGHATKDAVRRFQQATGLAQSGELEQSTLSALGVSSAM